MPADQLPTYARFYKHSTRKGDPNPDEHNKPEWVDVIMAEIMIKGDKNTSTSKRVYEDDGETEIVQPTGKTLPETYPVSWNAYQKGSEDYAEGTDLMVLPGIGLSDKRNMEQQGIMSVEDLASLNDSVVIGNSGMVNLRKSAKAYLDVLEPERVEAEKQAHKDEMQALKDQIEEMKALMAAEKPKRGRPKKEAAA